MNNQNFSAEQENLFNAIERFDIDVGVVDFPFAKRLARDNGWSLVYTYRVASEYKKFTFLAVASGHPVTPSDQVDQAWHLHLQYTESYWKRFCPDVLKFALHHGPTRGGRLEKEKFDDWYRKTLDSYNQFFGLHPPDDIWPAPSIRFGEDLHYQRVNTQHMWIVPKYRVYQFFCSLAAVIVVLEFL